MREIGMGRERWGIRDEKGQAGLEDGWKDGWTGERKIEGGKKGDVKRWEMPPT
jgi:hypothetical protein